MALAYQFCDKDYGLDNVKTLTDALNLDDDHLYEWACKSYSEEKGRYSLVPIKRTEKIFDYMFVYYNDDDGTDLQAFVSKEGWPENFETLVIDEAKIDEFCLITEENKVKALAITDLRKELKDAISQLLKRDDKNES